MVGCAAITSTSTLAPPAGRRTVCPRSASSTAASTTSLSAPAHHTTYIPIVNTPNRQSTPPSAVDGITGRRTSQAQVGVNEGHPQGARQPLCLVHCIHTNLCCSSHRGCKQRRACSLGWRHFKSCFCRPLVRCSTPLCAKPNKLYNPGYYHRQALHRFGSAGSLAQRALHIRAAAMALAGLLGDLPSK